MLGADQLVTKMAPIFFADHLPSPKDIFGSVLIAEFVWIPQRITWLQSKVPFVTIQVPLVQQWMRSDLILGDKCHHREEILDIKNSLV